MHAKRGGCGGGINAVTFVSTKFSQAVGFLGLSSAHLVGFQLYLRFLSACNMQKMENANWWDVPIKGEE